MILNQEDSLLFIIDIQEKLLNSVFNKETLEKKSKILTKALSILEIPVILSEQYPKGLGATVDSVKSALNQPELIYEKNIFNALAVPDVLESIKKTGKTQIVICGIETHICVYQTVMSLLDLGLEVVVVKDACGSRDEVEHLAALEEMRVFGAKIKTTEMVLFELLKGSKHPNFKEIQGLIK